MRPNGTFKISISREVNSPFLLPSRITKAQLVSFDVEATVGDAVQALTFEAKTAKISPPTGSQKWSNPTCGGAVRVVVGHVSTWAMGGHVDATLGVRTGRLWVVLTISPHKYVLSGACVRRALTSPLTRSLPRRALSSPYDAPFI